MCSNGVTSKMKQHRHQLFFKDDMKVLNLNDIDDDDMLNRKGEIKQRYLIWRERVTYLVLEMLNLRVH